MRHPLAVVLCACAVMPGAQTPPAPQSLPDQIAAAEAYVTSARPHTVADAEAEGAAYPRTTSMAGRPGPTPARRCMFVKPEQIGFPTSTGDPESFYLRSGDFEGPSISFGWDKTYVQAKLPLIPRYPNLIGAGLWIRVIRIDLTNPFFPSWPRFPTPGKWMLLATAGVNWGCFVLDRPIKTLSRAGP